MDVQWDVVLVTIILMFLLFVFSAFVRLETKEIPISAAPVKQETIDNGSLVIVSYKSNLGKIVKYFTGSRFTHVTLCVTIQGEKTIVEMGRYDNKKGLCMWPLEEFLEKNSEREIVVRHYTGKFPVDKLQRVLEELGDVEFESRLITWLKAITSRAWTRQTYTKFYCSQLIAYLLQEVGILEKLYLPECYQPRFFTYDDIPGYTTAMPLIQEIPSPNVQATAC